MTERHATTEPQDDPVARLAAANPVTSPPEDLGPVWERIEPRLSDFDVEVDAARTGRPSTLWRRRSVQVAAATTAALLLGGSGFAVGWTTAAPASPQPTPTPSATAPTSPTPTPSPSPSATATPADMPLPRLRVRTPAGDGLDIDASALTDQTTTAPVWQLSEVDTDDPRLAAMAEALGLDVDTIDDAGETTVRVSTDAADSPAWMSVNLSSGGPWRVIYYSQEGAGSDPRCAALGPDAEECWLAQPEGMPASAAMASVTDLLTQAGFDLSTLTLTARRQDSDGDGTSREDHVTEVNVAVKDGSVSTGGPAMTFTFIGDHLSEFSGWPTLPVLLGQYPLLSPRAAAARLLDPTFMPAQSDSSLVGPVTTTQPEPTATAPEVSSSLPVPWSVLPVRLVSAYLTTDTYIGTDGARFLLPTWVLVDDTGTAWRALALDDSVVSVTDLGELSAP